MNTLDTTDPEATTDILFLGEPEDEPATAAPAETPAPHAHDRRGTLRVRPAMDCSWGTTDACPRNGQITSLGPAGCFVKTKAELAPGQTLYVKGWLPTERWLTLRGTVSYHLPKVGFGFTFDPLEERDAEMLAVLLDFYGE
ncbi:MAG TPA: hypothetical protein VER32_02640 [Pyrinomonadaceae bacterium]|nr:hypothetical protein [Pyrinomonadaceae bacterium]